MEVPVYLPTDTGRLAGILGVPDRPNGVLLTMVTGGSRGSRAHRNRLWVKVARKLEPDGVFTLRLDLPGTGDSEGVPRRLRLVDPLEGPVAQAVRRTVDEVGAKRVLLAGTSLGARVCLAAAPLIPEATDVLYVVGPPVAKPPPAPPRRLYKAAHARLTKRMGVLKGILPTPRRGVEKGPGGRKRSIQTVFSRPLLEFTTRGNVRFVYGEDDPLLEEVQDALAGLEGRLDPGKVALEVVPGIELHGFQKIEAQDRTFEVTTRWVRDRIGEGLG